jgi:hypothetical protein
MEHVDFRLRQASNFYLVQALCRSQQAGGVGVVQLT